MKTRLQFLIQYKKSNLVLQCSGSGKSRLFWALWNGIEPLGECHLGPKNCSHFLKVCIYDCESTIKAIGNQYKKNFDVFPILQGFLLPEFANFLCIFRTVFWTDGQMRISTDNSHYATQNSSPREYEDDLPAALRQMQGSHSFGYHILHLNSI